MLLAVDSDLMHPVEPVEQYRHGVVYLGQMSTTKEGLVPMLHAVTDLGLAIYGLGESLQAGRQSQQQGHACYISTVMQSSRESMASFELGSGRCVRLGPVQRVGRPAAQLEGRAACG